MGLHIDFQTPLDLLLSFVAIIIVCALLWPHIGQRLTNEEGGQQPSSVRQDLTAFRNDDLKYPVECSSDGEDSVDVTMAPTIKHYSDKPCPPLVINAPPIPDEFKTQIPLLSGLGTLPTAPKEVSSTTQTMQADTGYRYQDDEDTRCASASDSYRLDCFREEERFILYGSVLDQSSDIFIPRVGPVLKPDSTLKSKTQLY